MRMIRQTLVGLLLVAALAACGKPQAGPPEATRPAAATEVPRPTATVPAPTVAPTLAPLPTLGKTPDVNLSFDTLGRLPGYRFEGLYRSRTTGEAEQFLRIVEEVDTSRNLHLLVYNQEQGDPELDLYYVDGHLYVAQEGSYIDLGAQDPQEAENLYGFYFLPFLGLLAGSGQLEPVGHETVNGLAAMKYRATLDPWVVALGAQQGVRYSAEGYFWIADEYDVLVRGVAKVNWTEGEKEFEYESQTEVSRVGQIAPMQPPQPVITLP